MLRVFILFVCNFAAEIILKIMINRFSKVLLVAVFSLFTLCGYGQCEAEIKDFYLAYMQNEESNESANVELLRATMSPELIARLKEYSQQYDVDAVVNAQDVCEYGIKSLTVVPQGEDVYMVKYKCNPESEYTCIKVIASDVDGKFTIMDISPVVYPK